MGHGESPSGPSTRVVMPCETWVSAAGSRFRPPVEWLCTSMKPGARTSPLPDITRSPDRGESEPGFATATIASPSIRTSAASRGAPVPSATCAPEIRIDFAAPGGAVAGAGAGC